MSVLSGNSNWVGNEFGFNAGVGVVIGRNSSASVVEQIKAVFERDWRSHYTKTLDPGRIPACSAHTVKENSAV